MNQEIILTSPKHSQRHLNSQDSPRNSTKNSVELGTGTSHKHRELSHRNISPDRHNIDWKHILKESSRRVYKKAVVLDETKAHPLSFDPNPKKKVQKKIDYYFLPYSLMEQRHQKMDFNEATANSKNGWQKLERIINTSDQRTFKRIARAIQKAPELKNHKKMHLGYQNLNKTVASTANHQSNFKGGVMGGQNQPKIMVNVDSQKRFGKHGSTFRQVKHNKNASGMNIDLKRMAHSEVP